MGNKATDDQIVVVRSIAGAGFSEMDIIRALHLANNDATAAINILFDSQPVHSSSSPSNSSRTAVCSGTKRPAPSQPRASSSTNSTLTPGPAATTTYPTVAIRDDSSTTRNDDSLAVSSSISPPLSSSDEDWWFVGTCDIAGLSTCKGRRLKPGERVIFSFPPSKPPPSPSTVKFSAKGRSIASCSEIVRFSSHDSGEIGRIPNEWARCLLPLVPAKKIRVEGCCKSAPEIINVMDTIILTVSVYINVSILVKCQLTSAKSITHGRNEESTYFPLLALFKLLGLVPFKKAEFTPEDLYKRKRPSLESQDGCKVHTTAILTEKNRKHSPGGINTEDEQGTVTIPDMDNIFGITDSSTLEEMDPPDYLECELRPYQKQALHWMVLLERGGCSEEAATTLHPCYNAYRLADKRAVAIYLNVFSGDATIEFPSTIQMARGGILADAMGLGKTIMTISLLLKCPAKWELHVAPASQLPNDVKETNSNSDRCSNSLKKTAKNHFFNKLMKSNAPLVEGRNLIICPMTLLGQWKAEIEMHTKPGCLTLCVHYGQSRPKDAKHLAQYDVVLTTYGVLSSEFLPENSQHSGGLYCVRWFRVILDEAHMIKSSKSQISLAASAISASRRWCLTGTPIQNNLEDVYSLLRFLRVEPWGNWSLWNKLIQKPYEEGDARGLQFVQSILKPIMLRRTKFSTDSEGRPIVVLPPINADVIYCEFTEAEKDFYEALYNKSKVKFNQFVEQGRVLHNYASILELLLRLRQCCDHPFLVMSRGDTQDFSDLNKLTKRFLKGSQSAAAAANSNGAPSTAYVVEVVENIRKGEKGECPICLETFEDAVLTPCAHCMCRECLLSSWKGATSGLCPICRRTILRHDLITAPSESRFQIDVENNWVESSKVSALIKELENLRTTGSKSIVFSQWTAFLDLLQIPLSRNKMMFVRLDGTLNQQQREKVISRFMEENDILVLLLSLKAGGVGINLTAASNAFILDPWWNPAVEEQAVMRIHRIGQSKSVSIKRFIVKGTVEEKMVSVQERKQRMISGALTDEEVRTARIEELKLLFS